MSHNFFKSAINWFNKKAFDAYNSGSSIVDIIEHYSSNARGTQELLSMYSTSPQMRAAISMIGYSVASTPWELYQVRGKGSNKSNKIKSITFQQSGFDARQKIKKSLMTNGEVEEINTHPILEILSAPNGAISGSSMMKLTQIYLDLIGESFWVIERNNSANIPDGIWPIPPHWVTKVPDDSFDYFEITIAGTRKNFLQQDVIWMRDLNLVNPYGRGTGIGQTLSDELETDEYASKFLKTWFVNRAKPELMISVEGASEDQLERAKENFDRKNRGVFNAHRSHWTSGKMIIKELQQKFVDMQLLDLRKYQRNIVNNTFGIPPEILGIVENSNRATIERAEYIYSKYVLVPRLDFLRNEIQNKLAILFDDKLVVDYVSPIPDDREAQIEILKASPQIATRGEWRSRAGLENRGDYDNIHQVPFGLTPEEAPKKPKQ